MAARRCGQCGISWPDSWKLYSKCPQCEETTDRIQNADPLDDAEALSWKRHCEFGRYYEAREEAKQLAEESEAFRQGAA